LSAQKQYKYGFFRRYHVVTYVFINDAARGYAVSIQDMLRAAGIAMDKAA